MALAELSYRTRFANAVAQPNRQFSTISLNLIIIYLLFRSPRTKPVQKMHRGHCSSYAVPPRPFRLTLVQGIRLSLRAIGNNRR